jgi:hypothetical protein
LEEVDSDKRKILKLSLEKEGFRMWSGLVWLKDPVVGFCEN